MAGFSFALVMSQLQCSPSLAAVRDFPAEPFLGESSMPIFSKSPDPSSRFIRGIDSGTPSDFEGSTKVATEDAESDTLAFEAVAGAGKVCLAFFGFPTAHSVISPVAPDTLYESQM